MPISLNEFIKGTECDVVERNGEKDQIDEIKMDGPWEVVDI